MALNPADRAFLKQTYQDLADKPLPPDSPFYEPVYQELGLDDPVQQIATLIDFAGIESIRLFPASAVRARRPNCSGCGARWRRKDTSCCMPTH
jgi:hypothetical protein